MKLKTIIVDDEKLARGRITRLLESDIQIEIIGECKNGFEALEMLSQKDVDLLFLDIQMPGMNGFEMLAKLTKNKIPTIIFVTAYDQFALKAFEVHAIDYLLKPFGDERFYSALEFAKTQISSNSDKNDFLASIKDLVSQNIPQQNFLKKISIKDNGKIYFVNTSDIIRIKSDGKYVEIIDSKNTHKLRAGISEIETKLDPQNFIRIHRSSIININQIKEIQHWYKNEYNFHMTNGDVVKSSSYYRNNLDKILSQF